MSAKPTGRAVLDKAMSEKDFAQSIVDLATLTGWKVYRTFDSRRSPEGWPDLVLVKDRLLFRELKSMVGKTTWQQNEWLIALRNAGEDVGIWRPSDWDAIEILLRGGRLCECPAGWPRRIVMEHDGVEKMRHTGSCMLYDDEQPGVTLRANS